MSLKIYFGSYESHGIIKHKTQRLRKVLQELSKLQYEIELIPSTLLNVITIYMKNQEIYRCNIRNLLFNIDYEEDVAAQKIVSAVQDAYLIFYSDTNVPKFPMKKEPNTDAEDYVLLPLLYDIGENKSSISINKQ